MESARRLPESEEVARNTICYLIGYGYIPVLAAPIREARAPRVSPMLDRVQSAIFLVLVFEGQKLRGTGTAWGIGPDLLVTCGHVVCNASTIMIVNEEPVFDGQRFTRAEAVALDERRDLALLKVSTRGLHALVLSTSEQLDDATPLLVWTWPGSHELESKLKTATQGPPDLRCASRAAVMTRWWPGKGRSVPLFSFAGHVEEGMSGGPVISALTGEVGGVVRACWPLDPCEIAENWRANVESRGWYDFSGGWGPPPDEIVEAQLGLGIGIAVPTRELQQFVETFSRKS